MGYNRYMKILLVDLMSLAFRSYYGGSDLSASDGTPTRILFTAVRTLLSEQKLGQYDRIIICRDPSRFGKQEAGEGEVPTVPQQLFRIDISPKYKSNRQHTHREGFGEDLRNLVQLFRLLGMPIYEVASYEADDIVGTLSVRLDSQGYSVAILSGDTDFAQLVTLDNSVVMRRLLPMKVETFGYEECLKKFGVEPCQVPSFKALAGDAADCIEGVPGVGAKTAQRYLERYLTVQGALQNEPKLQPFADGIQRDYSLALIDVSVPLDFSLIENRAPDYSDLQGALELLERLECKSLVNKINKLCL